MNKLSTRAGARARTPALPVHTPGEVGIWVAIMIDMTVFGVLFTVFMHYRSEHPALFNASSSRLHVTIGFINTLLLLTGSLGVVLGVRATRMRRIRAAKILISAAPVAGLLFMINKAIEYRAALHAGLTPTHNTFFTYYYALTIIHLVHVLLGTGLMTAVRRVATRENFRVKDMRFVEIGASYWHMVDLLWLILFALLYLIR
jgi:nitric oxide reductase NorE protein